MKHVQCVECKLIVGTVSMVSVDAENRPDILRTVCVPEVLPKKCPTCNGGLTRITLEGV